MDATTVDGILIGLAVGIIIACGAVLLDAWDKRHPRWPGG